MSQVFGAPCQITRPPSTKLMLGDMVWGDDTDNRL